MVERIKYRQPRLDEPGYQVRVYAVDNGNRTHSATIGAHLPWEEAVEIAKGKNEDYKEKTVVDGKTFEAEVGPSGWMKLTTQLNSR